jgi:hypothetical protein
MLPDGTSGAIAVWEDRRGGASDIYAQRVGSGGATWPGWPSGGRALCSAAENQVAPALAADGAGGTFVAWEDYRSGGANPDIYVQRVTGAGAVAAGWPADGIGVCTEGNPQGRPTIVADGAGGAIVLWNDLRAGNSDIYAQRLNASGAAQWGANGVPVCSATDHQRFPLAVSDGAGGAIVVWEDERVDDADVYVQRVNGSGSALWTPDGVALCAATLGQVGPRIVADGAGGAVVAWEDLRADNSDVYAQRVNAQGAPQWTADGVVLCSNLSEQYGVTIASDGGGGAFVAWNDLRNGLEDIYAQRVTSLGAIAGGWPVDGQVVCAATGSQFDSRAVSDQAGGAFFTWIDNRPGSAQLDVYAQHLTAAGGLAPGWSSNGLALCTAAADQVVTAVVPDGTGGAVAGWYDLRGGNADIYALRFSSAGSVPTVDVAPGSRPTPGWLAAAPNPLRSGTSLRFRLTAPERVTVGIVDVSGRRVRRLVDESLAAGDHVVAWDGRDQGGAPVPPGVYLAVLGAGADSRSTKLAVVR